MRPFAPAYEGVLVLWAMLFALSLGAGGSPGRSVPLLAIILSDGATQSLRDHPRRDVRANVQYAGVYYRGVKVHLKGSGSFQPISEKPSFTITFSRDSPFETAKVHLNNSAEDGTFLQEKIGAEMFASIGISTPRLSHARVRVNGTSKGMYVLKEEFSGVVRDKDFLSQPELAPLLEAAKEPNLVLRWEKLSALLDLNEFTTFVAMEVLICHWDGYALAENNFRVRRDSTTGRFAFIPSGMDQIFGNPRYPLNPEMGGALARALLEIPEGKVLFTQRVRELADKFDPARTTEQARADLASLQSSVSPSEFGEMRDALVELCSRIEARKKFVQAQVRTVASAH